jgi:hypothetical protein
MITALIPAIGALIGKVVDRAIPDRDKAEELKAQMTLALIQEGNAELQGAVSIIQAEAQGESWMQRNWRPILMLTIVAIVANNYLVAPYLAAMGLEAPTLELPERLWDLMTLGVGGYIGGRSIEKAVSAWKGGA